MPEARVWTFLSQFLMLLQSPPLLTGGAGCRARNSLGRAALRPACLCRAGSSRLQFVQVFQQFVPIALILLRVQGGGKIGIEIDNVGTQLHSHSIEFVVR